MPIINQVVQGGGGSAPAHYVEKSVDANGKLINGGTSVIDMTGVTDIGENVLYGAYQNNTFVSGVVDMSDLIYITGPYALEYAFENCSGITGVKFNSLTSITGVSCCQYAFRRCNLSSLEFPKLENIGNQTCNFFAAYNTNLITLKFQSLKTIGREGLRGFVSNCTSLQSVWFYALNTQSFGSFTNQFGVMLSSVTGCTVHFPMAIQSTIGSWSDVTNGFGGTNTTVLFDIVTSLTGADSNTYTRQEKDSTSTATAWLYNDTLYYTSGVSDNTNGVNEPSVSDAIYSDAACTQSVTTITAIA